MLSFVKKCFGPKPNPIGVDFGSDALRMAQVAIIGGEPRLIAAASCDVPTHARHDLGARTTFLQGAIRELLATGGFVGRAAVLALPASSMFIQHLRVPKMDEEALKKALPWEARGKLPIDPGHAILRHMVAGDVYQDQETRSEVILMAAGRDTVHQFLTTAARAKLDVVGMIVEPQALVDCFNHVYRRKADAEVTTCFVDVGWSGTRAVIARGAQILFARNVPVGGEHLTRAVAAAMGISQEDAKLMRYRAAAQVTQPNPPAAAALPAVGASLDGGEPASADNSFALLGAGLSAASKVEQAKPEGWTGVERRGAQGVVEEQYKVDPKGAPLTGDQEARRVEQASRDVLNKLVEELDLCRRYYEATFPNKPVDRLVFVGGEARHRTLCQHVARELGVAAQVGDPIVRMGKVSEVSAEGGLDVRQPQPGWAVSIGLSLGPVRAGGAGRAGVTEAA